MLRLWDGCDFFMNDLTHKTASSKSSSKIRVNSCQFVSIRVNSCQFVSIREIRVGTFINCYYIRAQLDLRLGQCFPPACPAERGALLLNQQPLILHGILAFSPKICSTSRWHRLFFHHVLL